MRLLESPGTLKRLRRTAWPYQRTFLTPLDDLPRFVDVILSAVPQISGAVAVFDRVVFEPHCDLPPLYAKHSLPPKYWGDDLTLEARDPAEASELLGAVLSEWIDFFFVPKPARFVVYADHDEFTTLFAHRRAHLSRVVDALTAAGFAAVDYVRSF